MKSCRFCYSVSNMSEHSLYNKLKALWEALENTYVGYRMSIFKKASEVAALILINLIALLIAFEIFGAIANSAATSKQTSQAIHDIENLLCNPVVSDVYSETGNTSGTGNHVDMLSIIVFQTDDSIEEIIEKLQDKYDFNEWYCRIEAPGDIQEKPDVYKNLTLPDKTDNCYIFYLNRSAPFRGNIAGH